MREKKAVKNQKWMSKLCMIGSIFSSIFTSHHYIFLQIHNKSHKKISYNTENADSDSGGQKIKKS